MAVELEQLRKEANASPSANETERLTSALALAEQLVDKYLEDNLEPEDLAGVPEAVVDKAVLVCALDAFAQSKAPNGVTNEQYDVGGGEVVPTPIRVSRDPMRGARQVLELWVLPAVGG